MELRQLRYFVAVAEELHFRRAAERLHMSQPPLSHQIRLLEEELGCELLARTRRRVEMTPAGAAFLRDARAVLADLDRAAHNARRIHEGQTGTLRVSFAGSALLSLVPRVVQRLSVTHPAIDIELHERSTSDQIRALGGGGHRSRPRAAAGRRRRRRDRGARPRAHGGRGPGVASARPRAGAHVRAARRVPLRPVPARPGARVPRPAHDLGDERGTPPRVIQQASETQTIIGLVAAGVGVSLVPASVQQLALDGVAYRPVSGAPDTELAALTRRGDRTGLIAAFLEAAA